MRKGKFDLLFPRQENVETYKKFFNSHSYKNEVLWSYLEGAKEKGEHMDWVKDLIIPEFNKPI